MRSNNWRNQFRLGLCAFVAIGMSACGSTAPEAVFVDAAPEKGFEYPYLLMIPDVGEAEISPFLLVEPNNTGTVSDDFDVHRKAAERMAKGSCLGHMLALELHTPFLIPIFPRPENEWTIYTHALDRDSMLLEQGPMCRLDLQLIAMIDDARARLAAGGVTVAERVLLNGFSASGTFVNRFTFLHPERVRAVASGGVNGIPMLPVERVGAMELPYPLGLADFEALVGHSFDRDSWSSVPQWIYMGAEDENDAVAYADGYGDEERAVVHAVLGETMMPDRWEECREIYAEHDNAATLVTYGGIGHGTNREIHLELIEFFREHIAVH